MHGMFEKQKVVAIIEDVITPYIGQTMAKASTQVHCEKLGLAREQITTEEIESLLDRLRKAMLVFVGREKTEQILTQINRTIGLGG
jgi:hypothetical protein